MTERQCKCGVRNLEDGEDICPACKEADRSFWKKVMAGAGGTVVSILLAVVTRGAFRPKI